MIAAKHDDKRHENSKNRSLLWVRGIEPFHSPYGDKSLSLFQPDVVMPREFLATYKRTLHLNPERALMLAVLADAVMCFQDNLLATQDSKRRLFAQTEEWFFAEDHLYVFSFESVCELLGFDPGYLRRGLLCWKEVSLASRRRQIGYRSNNRRVTVRAGAHTVA